MTQVYYNSWLEQHKQPFGAMIEDELVSFSISVSAENIEYVQLIIQKEKGLKGKETYRMIPNNEGSYQFSYTLDQGKGLYFYYFSIQPKWDKTIFYGAKRNSFGGLGVTYDEEHFVNPYQLTCFQQADPAPDWYREAVFYQIFPDRFFNGNENRQVNQPKKNMFIYGRQDDEPMYIQNGQGEIIRWDFQGGNLLGIIKKIPYLKELGVNAIYLNPIFEADSNHRYDTGDYLAIDGILGDEHQFKALIDQLHDNGMRLVLDGVFNHVGQNSRYFNENGQYGREVGASQNKNSPYYHWFTFTEYPKEYKAWWGVKDLPEVNKEDATFQTFIYGEKDSVLTKWNELGVDGWRLDVADELPDFFIQGIRHNLNQYDEKVLLGEVWEDASNKIAYNQRRAYILGNGLHGVMNYPFKENIIALLNGEKSSKEVAQNMTVLKENYPQDILYNNLNNLGTHDTERILSVFQEDKRKTITAFSLMMILPGVPCLYYGDEAGLTGGKDPKNRKFYPWGNEDPILLKEFKDWIHVRRTSKVLQKGLFIPFYTKELFGVLRYLDHQSAIYIVNPTAETQPVSKNEFCFTCDIPEAEKVSLLALDYGEIPAYSGKLFLEQ